MTELKGKQERSTRKKYEEWKKPRNRERLVRQTKKKKEKKIKKRAEDRTCKS